MTSITGRNNRCSVRQPALAIDASHCHTNNNNRDTSYTVWITDVWHQVKSRVSTTSHTHICLFHVYSFSLTGCSCCESLQPEPDCCFFQFCCFASEMRLERCDCKCVSLKRSVCVAASRLQPCEFREHLPPCHMDLQSDSNSPRELIFCTCTAD